MCGIVGYVGEKNAVPLLLRGLKKLEYRGYDSAGIAVLNNGVVDVRKVVGVLDRLSDRLEAEPLPESTSGIGHTRWATHGKPSDENSHPHTDCHGHFAVVHNGIIENYLELKQTLKERGHEFRSETDTEVVPHLIEEYYEGDLLDAVRKAVKRMKGSFAVGVVTSEEHDRMVAARKDSPLIVGIGEGENFIASDIPAVLEHTRRVYILNDGEIADITANDIKIYDANGHLQEKDVFEVQWDPEQAEKGGYEHFMLKEITEQPEAIRNTLSGRIAPDDSRVILEELTLSAEQLQGFDKVHVVACGTAYHAGLVAKRLIEKWVRMPVVADVASEYRYRDPLTDENTLLLIISQSGETTDTLMALREGKARGATVVAITNVVGSSVAREADYVLYTWAGPEIAVASTKAYTTQLVTVTLLALWLEEHLRGALSPGERGELLSELRELPQKAQELLNREEQVKQFAALCAEHDDVFFIGRGLDFDLALEGQLKLKEISYVHAEAYPAGELKHGTLALITKGVPVVALATQPQLLEKMASNIQEVKAREATVAAITLDSDTAVESYADYVLRVPDVPAELVAPLAAIPLQLIAYYAAVARGTDVDKPRNLAKSVTVE